MQRMEETGRVNPSEERLRQLLIRGLAGDAPAYHAFLQDLSAHLRAYLRRRLARLPDEVEDLVQESLLAIHNQRHTYDAGQPLTAWVHAIAKYKLIDLLRRRAKRDLLNDPLDDEFDLGSAADTEAAEARRDLGKLLARRPGAGGGRVGGGGGAGGRPPREEGAPAKKRGPAQENPTSWSPCWRAVP